MRTKIATYFKIFEIMRTEKAASKVTIKFKKKTHTKRCAFSFWRNRTDRFEDLNATVRWTVARIRLDGFDTIIFLFTEKKNASKSGRYHPGSLPVNFFFDPKSEKNGNMLAILAVMGYTVAD